MGNCISCIKPKRQPKRSVTLAILGLDSAGKTTTSKALIGEPLDTAPTIGFNKEEFTFKNYDIRMFDLGGGRRIRDIWKEYLSEIYGVIYVVDTAAPERFSEVKESLTSLLSHEQVKEKPLLVLGNKVDLPEHMDEVEVMDKLNLEELVNVNKCPCKLEMCSAIKGTGRKMDPKINEGMAWLCSLLDQIYEKLKIRVDRDMEVVEQVRQKEKEARLERVRKRREERERQEEEERKKLGMEKVEEDDEDDDIVGGNPWKALTAEEIKKKDEKYKQNKVKEKERQRKLEELAVQEKSTNIVSNERSGTPKKMTAGDDNDDDDGIRAPRSSRSLFGLGWMNGALSSGTGEEGSNSHRPGRQLLPPLESVTSGNSPRGKKQNKKLKNKVQSFDSEGYNIEKINNIHNTSSVSTIHVKSVHPDDDGNDDGNDDGDDNDDDAVQQTSARPDFFRNSKGLYIDGSKVKQGSPDSGRKKKGRKKKPQLSSDGEEGFDTLRLSQHLDNDVDRYSSHMNDGRDSPDGRMANGDIEERSNTPVKKLKKKKKHLRKNKLAPSDDEFELSDVQTTPKKQPIPWVRSPSPRKMLDDEDSHTNWGMVEDLAPADEVQQFHRSRPNFDSEDDLIL